MVVMNTIIIGFFCQSLRTFRTFSLPLYIDSEKAMCQTAMHLTATYFGDFKCSGLPYSSCRRRPTPCCLVIHSPDAAAAVVFSEGILKPNTLLVAYDIYHMCSRSISIPHRRENAYG